MPTVSCPSCSTHQSVEASATSYTCGSCGSTWDFVVCDTCGSRFHSRPGSTGWTCPNCGTPHGSALADEGASPDQATAEAAEEPPAEPPATPAPVSIMGDDLDSAPREPLGGPQEAFGAQEAGSPFPMPSRDRTGGLGGLPSWALIAAAVVAVVIVGGVVFRLVGGGGSDASPAATVDATAATCQDVQQTQILRADALGRARQDLRDDVAALKQAGDKPTAKQVTVLIGRLDAYRTALQNQEDTTDEVAAISRAIRALPC
jgi:predicted RNA-binding Zn-ribbon protein involved in translation (DUF1610 family)